MSTPWCDRPPERGAPQLSTKLTAPRTGHTRLPEGGGGSTVWSWVGVVGVEGGFVVGDAPGRVVGEAVAGFVVVVACARGCFGLARGGKQTQLLLLLRVLRLELLARPISDEQLVLHRLRLGIELREELVGLVLRRREVITVALEIRLYSFELVDRVDLRRVRAVEEARRASEVEHVVTAEQERAGDGFARADVRTHRDLLHGLLQRLLAAFRFGDPVLGQCEVLLELRVRGESGFVAFRGGVGRLLRARHAGPGPGQIVAGIGVRRGRERPHEHHQQQQDARATATKGHPGGKG